MTHGPTVKYGEGYGLKCYRGGLLRMKKDLRCRVIRCVGDPLSLRLQESGMGLFVTRGSFQRY